MQIISLIIIKMEVDMLYKIKRDVVNLIDVNEISDFPVSINLLKDVICSRGYELYEVPGVGEPFTTGEKLVYPKYESKKELRISLMRELGHIIMHKYEGGYCELSQAQEWEADVFAMYCSMPPGVFDQDLRTHSIWQLVEKYGIPVEYVRLRAAIAQQMVS